MPEHQSQIPLHSHHPSSWHLYIFPLVLALIGILIATTAAKLGQNYERQSALAVGLPLTTYMQPGRHFTQWDAYRYEEIILQGYLAHRSTDPPDIQNASILPDPITGKPRLKNVVWYPLYPLLGWLLTKAAGGETGWLPAHTSLTLISQLSLILAALVTFALSRRHFQNFLPALFVPLSALSPHHPTLKSQDSRLLYPPNLAALYTVAFLILSPCAIFFYANYTESLFLLFLALFLLFIQSKKWWPAALIAALASATRSQGALFAPVLALTFLMRSPLPIPKRLPTALLLSLTALLGLLAYMLYLALTFGDPLIFLKLQKLWNVGLNPNTLIYSLNPLHALTHFYHYLIFRPFDAPRLYESLCVIFPPILLLLGRRYLSLEQSLIAWLLWALPYVSNALAGNPPMSSQWMSMSRFILVAIPIPMIFAATLLRFRWLAPLILILNISIFTAFCYLYGAGHWVG